MAHDGAEGLSPEGWLPDRISVGVLAKAFPPDVVDEVIDLTGTREARCRLLPTRLVVYFVLALWLFRGRNSGYRQVMAKLADGLHHRRQDASLLDGQLGPGDWAVAGRRWRQPGASSLSRARDKLGPDPLRILFEHAAGDVAAGGAAARCCGLWPISVDGASTGLPGSEQNEAFFGRPPATGWSVSLPQVRWVAAADSGTGALIGASFGPYRTDEQTRARDLLDRFGPDMLVLAGPGFLSWSLARAVRATGAHILWRAPPGFALPLATGLDDGTYLATLRPLRAAEGPPLPVRVIRYTVRPGPGATNPAPESFCLVTSLLDTGKYPALDLACCYPARWGCQALIGHYEHEAGAGQPVLRSKDPDGVAQEMWALFAVYQAICLAAGAGAGPSGIPPGWVSLPQAPPPGCPARAVTSPWYRCRRTLCLPLPRECPCHGQRRPAWGWPLKQRHRQGRPARSHSLSVTGS